MTGPDLEIYLLSTLLSWPEQIPEVTPILKGEDFTMQRHQVVFEGLLALMAAGTVVDAGTLRHGLEKAGRLREAGGDEFIIEVMSVCAASGVTAPEHARIIRDASLRRGVHRKILESMEAVKDPTKPLPEVAGMLESAALAAVATEAEEGLKPTKAYLGEVFAIIERQSKGEITGLKTGFFDLDQHTSGFQNSDLIVLGGRPRMGKTALATDIAYNVGIDQRKHVAFFELEMAGRQIVERKLFSLAKVNGQVLRRGQLPQRDYPRLALAVGPLEGARVFIDHTTSLTPLQMLAKCRRMKSRSGLDLVVVDNIQKMRGDGNYKGNFRLEIADITKNLKNYAKDLDVPILAISHLSRGPDHRADPEPVLSDLQESGNIEQDADIVMLLYREEVYKEVPEEKRGETKVIFAKYRNGQEGYKLLRFNEEFSSFENWGGNREEPAPSYKELQAGDDFMRGMDGN